MRAARIRPAGGALFVSVALVIALVAGPPMAGAATVTREWRAKVGSSGANGSATVQGYTTGAGATVLKLVKLKPSTLLPVMISKGTCAAVGSTVVKLPSVKSSSTGAVSKTLSLTAAQVTAIKNASAAGKMAFRVGSGSTLKCGVFTVIPKPPVVGATITVGSLPEGVAITPNGVFVANWWDNTLSKVDPATNTVLVSIPLTISGNAGPEAMAYGEGALWVTVTAWDEAGTSSIAGSLLRVDPATGQTVATIPMGRYPVSVATSPGAVWVASYDDGTIARVDPATNAVTATITVAPRLVGLAYGEGSLWATNEDKGTVTRVDPATNTAIATITTGRLTEGIAVGAGSVWTVNYGAFYLDTAITPGFVSRIDPATNAVVRTIELGTDPAATKPIFVSFGGGYLWVAMFKSSVLVQVDPATNAVKSRVTTGPIVTDDKGSVVGLHGVAATDGSVWITQPIMPASADAIVPPGKLVRVYY